MDTWMSMTVTLLVVLPVLLAVAGMARTVAARQTEIAQQVSSRLAARGVTNPAVRGEKQRAHEERWQAIRGYRRAAAWALAAALGVVALYTLLGWMVLVADDTLPAGPVSWGVLAALVALWGVVAWQVWRRATRWTGVRVGDFDDLQEA